MPIQTTYGYLHDALLQGMIADATPCVIATSYADAAVGFGLGVIYDGATDGKGRSKIAVPSSGFDSGLFQGVTIFEHKQQYGANAGINDIEETQTAEFEPGYPIPILRKGRIQVWVEGAANPTSSVFLRHTANGAGTAAGQFRTDADTANAVDVSAYCKFTSTRTDAGLITVELNLP